MGESARRMFTVEEFQKMGEAGVLGPDERVELIRGEIRVMSAMGPRHANRVARIAAKLTKALGERAFVWCQLPVVLEEFSQPLPDIAVHRERGAHYDSVLPKAGDAYLLIEVADSMLSFDRKVKGPLYAETGVPEYWLVDVKAQRIERYTEPGPNGYARVERLGRGDVLAPIALPGFTISVDELLGE